MTVREFLVALEEGCGVVLPDALPPPSGDVARAADALAGLDRHARLGLAHDAPPFSLPAASWAAVLLYRACQFLVFREVGAEIVRQTLAEPCPLPPSPSVAYSVDLTFRWLPDVVSLARGVAGDDPLVAGLLELARAWPLSSVGVRDVGDVDVASFIEHPSLRQLYVDRILERRDLTRISMHAIREAVRESLGSYAEMCPEAAAAVGGGSGGSEH